MACRDLCSHNESFILAVCGLRFKVLTSSPLPIADLKGSNLIPIQYKKGQTKSSKCTKYRDSSLINNLQSKD